MKLHFMTHHRYQHKNKTLTDALRHAARGLGGAFLYERNIRFQVLALVVAIVAGLIVQLSLNQWLIVALVSAAVLVIELINSSIEAVADALHPDFNEHIQRAKDMSASAVLLTTAVAAVAGGVIFVPKIINLVGL